MKNIANDLLKASIIIEKSGIEEDVIGVAKHLAGDQLKVQVADVESLLKISDKLEVIDRGGDEYPFEICVDSEGIRFFTVEEALPNFLTEAI